jgi:hypothetical protein
MTAPDYRYVLHDANDADVDSLDFVNGPAYVPYVTPVLRTSLGSRFGRFKHLAKRITRAPVVLFNGTSTNTLALIAPWPLNGAKLSIVASSVTGHTDCAGHVFIDSDDIIFTQAGTKISTPALTALPAIATAGLDCNLKITVLGSGGQPIYLDTETDLPCKIEVKSKSIPDPSGGWTSIRSTQIQARGIFEIGDNIKFDIDYPFDPTNGTTQPIAAWRPKTAYAGKESIKILEF